MISSFSGFTPKIPNILSQILTVMRNKNEIMIMLNTPPRIIEAQSAPVNLGWSDEGTAKLSGSISWTACNIFLTSPLVSIVIRLV